MDEAAYLATVEFRDNELSEVELEHLVCLEQSEVLLVEQGGQGPPGPPGPDGGSAVQRIAATELSALRVVYELEGQVRLLDYRDDEHVDLVLGITLTAATAGAPINVQRSGWLEDAGWSWSPGRVWLGADGGLTQSAPLDGYDLLLGVATSATRITLDIQEPIQLEV